MMVIDEHRGTTVSYSRGLVRPHVQQELVQSSLSHPTTNAANRVSNRTLQQKHLPMDTEEINPEDITREAFGVNGDQLYVYSDASVIDGGRKGTGAWHMKGDKIKRQTRIYPVDRPLSSTRGELFIVLKCLLTIRDKYTGKIRLALDNLSVVRKFN